jgi:hypothetical protein
MAKQVRMKISKMTVKAVWRFLRKLEIEFLYDPLKLLLVIYPKECKAG